MKISLFIILIAILTSCAYTPEDPMKINSVGFAYGKNGILLYSDDFIIR
jgi:hypothetical protein